MGRRLDPKQAVVRTTGRVIEARPIVAALARELNTIELRNQKAGTFIEQMARSLAVEQDPLVTEKQLEWLRNLAEQFLGGIPEKKRSVAWK